MFRSGLLDQRVPAAATAAAAKELPGLGTTALANKDGSGSGHVEL